MNWYINTGGDPDQYHPITEYELQCLFKDLGWYDSVYHRKNPFEYLFAFGIANWLRLFQRCPAHVYVMKPPILMLDDDLSELRYDREQCSQMTIGRYCDDHDYLRR